MKKLIIASLMSLGLLFAGSVFAAANHQGTHKTVVKKTTHKHKNKKKTNNNKVKANTCMSCINH